MLKDYQKFVRSNWNGDNGEKSYPLEFRDLFIMTAGLGGETGEVLEWLKKNERDRPKDLEDLKLELGDVLYYLTMIGEYYGFSLKEIMSANMDKLVKRRKNKEKTNADTCPRH